jgi:hypothetical protein
VSVRARVRLCDIPVVHVVLIPATLRPSEETRRGKQVCACARMRVRARAAKRCVTYWLACGPRLMQCVVGELAVCVRAGQPRVRRVGLLHARSTSARSTRGENHV